MEVKVETLGDEMVMKTATEKRNMATEHILKISALPVSGTVDTRMSTR